MLAQTRNSAPTYTAGCWITGSPIGLDADPNTVGGGGAGSVAALRALNRIITTPTDIFVTSALAMAAFACDGSSTCIVRFWWYDDVQLIWVPNGNLLTLTTASTNTQVATAGCMPGCKFYCQVTANAGNTTKIAFLVR